MKRIGFNNFRKFEHFPAIELAPITLFVGENNAGKSTVVKGIIALSDFFNKNMFDEDRFLMSEDILKKTPQERKKIVVANLKSQKFYFNSSYFAHIGTFKRALYNKAQDSVISFYTTVGHGDYTIEVVGDRDDDERVSGIISRVLIDYRMLGMHIEFDLQNDLARVQFSSVSVSEDQLDFLPPKMRKSAREYLGSISHSYEFSFDISDYYRRFVPDLIYLLKASVEIAFSSSMELEKTIKHVGSEVFLDLKPIANIDSDKIAFLKDYSAHLCPADRSKEWMFLLPDTDFMFYRYFRIEYLYAHAVTQTVLYSAKDSNDYLSRTIHEFASLSKTDDDYRKQFITRWMKELKIGDDYQIKSVGGEAHIVKIKNSDGDFVNLADKGMGTIQLMVLLFRLAITLPKVAKSSKKSKRIYLGDALTIIIEEPEQNLHPMLQSKLADLFYELNDMYGLRFIIETHSEYLIRETQVLVGNRFNKSSNDKFISENPFKVFYFPADGAPYDMGYTSSGLFREKFGDGFINEAGRLHMTVLKSSKTAKDV